MQPHHPFIAQLTTMRRAARRRRRIQMAMLAVGLGLLVAPMAVADAGAQSLRSCAVAVLQGQAAVERGGVRYTLAVGAVLTTADRVVSGAESRVEIRCNDGVRLNIGADTRLELATLVGPAESARSVAMQLLEGIVRIALPAVRSWRRFEVQTPTAVASVRSTDWTVEVAKTGATAIFVVEGQVLASDRAGSQGAFLQAGEGIDFRPDGSMAASVRWGEARVKRTLAALAPR